MKKPKKQKGNWLGNNNHLILKPEIDKELLRKYGETKKQERERELKLVEKYIQAVITKDPILLEHKEKSFFKDV